MEIHGEELKFYLAIFGTQDERFDYDEIENLKNTFGSLSLEHQLSVLKKLSTLVKKERKLEDKEFAESECGIHGHSYGKWEERKMSRCIENPYLHSRDYLVPEGYEYISEDYSIWERSCVRCGVKEKVEQEPPEHKEVRKKREKSEKIKKLKMEIKKLESSE